MRIKCLFIMRDERSGPELLEAWDEYTVSESLEGWQKACEAALKTVGESGYLRHRIISVDVPDKGLLAALTPAEIPGEIDESNPQE